MSDDIPTSNRIPFETLKEGDVVSPWRIPSVGSSRSKKVFNAKRDKEQREKARRGEVIEDVTVPSKPRPLTAEALKALTEQATKEGFDQGYQEGVTKGLEEGRAKGEKDGQQRAYKETKAEIDASVARLRSMCEELLDPMEVQSHALENIVTDMAIQFAQSLMGRELNRDPETLVNIVQEALRELPAGSTNVSVFVCERDAELIQQYLPENQRAWQLKIDSKLAPGGCRVETHESLVDFSVEHRLARYIKHVRAHEAHVPNHPIPDYRAQAEKQSAQHEDAPQHHEGVAVKTDEKKDIEATSDVDSGSNGDAL